MKITLIACGIKNSGNLGALARLCDNFNLERLILISPDCEIDDHAYERATHGRYYLDNVITLDELQSSREYVDVLIALSARMGGYNNLGRSSLSLSSISKDLINADGSLGLVLGREDFGLSNAEIDYCDIISHIALPGDNQVLNISHAGTIALWELFREYHVDNSQYQVDSKSEKNDDEPPLHQLMCVDKKNAFFKFLYEILEHSWISEESYQGIERVFRSLFGRALITNREGNAIVGTLRGILKSLTVGHPPGDNCKLSKRDASE